MTYALLFACDLFVVQCCPLLGEHFLVLFHFGSTLAHVLFVGLQLLASAAHLFLVSTPIFDQFDLTIARLCVCSFYVQVLLAVVVTFLASQSRPSVAEFLSAEAPNRAPGALLPALLVNFKDEFTFFMLVPPRTNQAICERKTLFCVISSTFSFENQAAVRRCARYTQIYLHPLD